MFFRIGKDKDMLCGPACLHYVLNFMYNKNICIPNDLFWTADIASFIRQNTNLKSQLTCYDSNLYNDYVFYKLLECIPDYSGFNAISKYLSLGGIINEKKLSTNIITSMLYENIIIACVSSSIFNNDNKRKGGHFIILLQNIGKNYMIANPKKNTIEIEIANKEHILNSITNFGSWIITISKKDDEI